MPPTASTLTTYGGLTAPRALAGFTLSAICLWPVSAAAEKEGWVLGASLGPAATYYAYDAPVTEYGPQSTQRVAPGIGSDWRVGFAVNPRTIGYLGVKAVRWYSPPPRDWGEGMLGLLLPFPDKSSHVQVGLGGMYSPAPTLPDLYLDASIGLQAWPCRTDEPFCAGPGLTLGAGYEIWPHVPVALNVLLGGSVDSPGHSIAMSTVLSVGLLAY